ncbi:MAG: magnesium transporter [Candidatus Hodarchaeales archaeon]|jgi:mgtE-like transporter
MSQSSTDRKLFQEALFALGISVFGGLFTGILWADISQKLAIFVGILALIPVIGQMRGNISGIFTSRLGTGLHLGSIEPSIRNRSKELNNTLIMNILVSFFTPIWVALIVYILHFISGGTTEFYHFFIIALFAGIISASIQMILTITIAFGIYKGGRDPDVLAYPLLSATGDVITAIGIIGGIYVDQHVFHLQSHMMRFIVEIFSLFLLAFFLIITLSRPIRSRLEFDIFNLLSEAVPVVFLAVIIGAIVGIVMEGNITYAGILLILPSYMAYTGSMGAIIGSKYTTAYYLGLLDTRSGKINTYLQTPVILIVIGIILSTLLGIIGYYVAIFFDLDLPKPDMFSFLFICWITGVLTTLFSIFNSLLVGNITFQHGIDADNVIVPFTSTIGDLVAIITIVLALSLILTG